MLELVVTPKFTQFLEATKKDIIDHYTFEGEGEDNAFGAVRKAEEKAKELGLTLGRMCIDEPIALAFGKDYVAKWWNIEMKDWPKIDGLLISECFRRENVTLYLFKQENVENDRKD